MTPSALACRLTILWMFKPPRDPLFEPPEAKFCYLHTLTFKDPEPSYREARRRWHSFNGWLNETNKWGVCVPQWGEKTGRLHFHLVTTERWDAKELWAKCDAYGFGRYDVRERPVETAGYAARYVGRKNLRPPEAEGMRLWSVFGKKHFPHGVSRACDCEEKKTTCHVVAESPQLFADWLVIKFPGVDTAEITLQLRPDAQAGGPARMNEITSAHLAIIAPEIARGYFVGIGEYRSCDVAARDGKDYKDSSKKTRLVFATHRIEFGGVQKIVEEKLPADTVIDSFVAPAKSGEMVGFSAEKSTEFNKETKWKGRIYKLTVPVPAVAGKAVVK